MRPSASRRIANAVIVLCMIGWPLAALAYEGPRLSATYTLSEPRVMPGGVDVSFSFVIRNTDAAETAVDRIDLGDLSGAEPAFATFDGGTLPGHGTLRDSAVTTVPQSVFERWRSGGPATLFVYARTGRGDVRRVRVNAYRVPAGR